MRAARANLNLALGDYERAREDLPKVEQVDAENYSACYWAALMALELDEPDLYRAYCQKLVESIGEEDEAVCQYFAAWTAALAPGALSDYQKAIRLAETSVEQDPSDAQLQNGLGAIRMRAGEFDQALVALQEASESASTTKSSSAYLGYYLAMTQHHLNRTEDARRSLAEANQVAQQEFSDETNPPAWNRRLTLGILGKQAEALIGTAPSAR